MSLQQLEERHEESSSSPYLKRGIVYPHENHRSCVKQAPSISKRSEHEWGQIRYRSRRFADPCRFPEAEAQVMAFGANKYGRDNWRGGID